MKFVLKELRMREVGDLPNEEVSKALRDVYCANSFINLMNSFTLPAVEEREMTLFSKRQRIFLYLLNRLFEGILGLN